MADTSASSALPIPAFQLACWFIKRGQGAKVYEVSHMMLQKLIYFAHSWHLAIYDKPLIKEYLEAWQYGPVVRSLWQRYKYAGLAAIPFDEECKRELEKLEPLLKDTYLGDYLEKIWNIYGDMSAYQLSSITHRPGSPWLEARNGNENGHSSLIIPEDKITSYYKHMLTQAPKNRPEREA